MAFRFIIVYLLFFVCHHAKGARDVLKQHQKTYGAAEGLKEMEESSNEPYIAEYGHNSKQVETPYIMGYIGRKEAETPYIMGYTGRKSPNYITNYGTKEAKEVQTPYVMGYGNKEGREEAETPYIMAYEKNEGTKEVETPYVMGYGNKEGTKEVETPYVMGYGNKEGEKEVETPYKMSYGTKAVPNYITQYGTKEDIKEVDPQYITQYGTKDEKDEPYITSYRTTQGSKEGEAPYITGYTASMKCKHGKHDKHVSTAPSHEHDHHHHHMDHNEASKQGFFTVNDFYKGKTMPLNFPNQEHSRFLPKQVAESIPFSTPQLPHLLQLFSIPQGSPDAKHMAYALEQCEMKPIKGETKYCATSLESMVDFVKNIIGSTSGDIKILSTTHPTTSTSITQSYTILEDPQEVVASKMVFCHPVPYPYAVFFCHHFEKDTKFFKVSLGGENGDKVEAVAVCHMDTSDWDPAHSVFDLLGIKAGPSSPVCHFFPENHLVWIPSPIVATI